MLCVNNKAPSAVEIVGYIRKEDNTRPALVDFAYLICKNNSLMISANIVQVRTSWLGTLEITLKSI